MDREWIKSVLPHREPFLLLDEVVELEPGVHSKAVWHITGDEYFFKGHFPGIPVVPGVLIIEALAQTGGAAVLVTPESKGKTGFLTGVDKARFRRKVVPGDTLTLEAVVVKFRLGMCVCDVSAHVDGELAVKAAITFAVG